jgi:hypothetical protein
VHARTVRVDGTRHRVSIEDTVCHGTGHRGRLAFHLGPEVSASLDGAVVELSWPSGDSESRARLLLPPTLRWSAHRGDLDPIVGWYSPRFGVRTPITTLLGVGDLSDGLSLRTELVLTSSPSFSLAYAARTLEPAEQVARVGRG